MYRKVLKASNHKSHIEFESDKELRATLANLPDEIEVVLRNEHSSRTTPQNKYYWSVVIEILSQEFGYVKDEMHEILKTQFLKNYIMLHDKEVEIVRSTTDLTTMEMEDYLAKIRMWALEEHHVKIPLPNEIEV